MKQFTRTQLALLHLLSDGKCHSGNVLGETLAISRTAVWKNINQLIELGAGIQRISKQGYQLIKPFIPLDEKLIRQCLLQQAFDEEINIHLLASINSTNLFLKDLASTGIIDVCCAEKQTQGRGRFNRQWVSPFGENIYCSSRWELNCCLSQLSGLSLVVGLAILASLKDSDVLQDIRIKWPNDILWNNKKLCGILIEVVAEANSRAQIIIGIGLNVNTNPAEKSLAEKPWCSLNEITNSYYDRNILLANLIINLSHYLKIFLAQGFLAFLEAWHKADYLQGQIITVTQTNTTLKGLACGVNELGQLCLQDEQGKLHYLSAGDTSISSWD